MDRTNMTNVKPSQTRYALRSTRPAARSINNTALVHTKGSAVQKACNVNEPELLIFQSANPLMVAKRIPTANPNNNPFQYRQSVELAPSHETTNMPAAAVANGSACMYAASITLRVNPWLKFAIPRLLKYQIPNQTRSEPNPASPHRQSCTRQYPNNRAVTSVIKTRITLSTSKSNRKNLSVTGSRCAPIKP